MLTRECDDVLLKLDSKYKLSRSINLLVQTMECPNSNYGRKEIPKTLQLQHARAILRDTNDFSDHISLPVFNQKIPQFCLGAFVDLVQCVDLVFDEIISTISSIPGATLKRVLNDAFFLGCCDGAIFDTLQSEMKNITTFSITLISRFLVENCAIYPSSKNWILAHFQLNGNETVGHLKYIFKQIMFEWSKICKQRNICIPFKDLGDGKLLYMLTSHSA